MATEEAIQKPVDEDNTQTQQKILDEENRSEEFDGEDVPSDEHEDAGSVLPLVLLVLAQATPLVALMYLEYQAHHEKRAILTPPYQDGSKMQNFVDVAPGILVAASATMLLLWCLDFHEWSGIYWVIGWGCFLIPAATGGIVLALANSLPDVALTIMLVVALLTCVGIRATVENKDIGNQRYFRCMKYSAGCMGFVFGALAIYAGFVLDDIVLEGKLANHSNTVNTNATVTPMVGALFNVIVMLGVRAQASVKHIKNLTRELKLAVLGIASVFMLYWAALSMASIQMDESENSISLFFRRQAMIVGVLVICFMLRIRRALLKVGAAEGVPDWVLHITESDWLRALWLCISLPFIPIIAVCSTIRSGVRALRGKEENKTAIPYNDWDMTSVLTKAVSLMFIFLLLTVLMRDGMNWVRDTVKDNTEHLSIPMLTLVLYTVGVALFTLPPTTGVPIYALAGNLLPDRFASPSMVGGNVVGLGDSEVWKGIIVATLMSLCMKLTGCVIQQQIIGKQLGNRPDIRKMVGVHTVPIRATEAILKGDRAFPKICILLGCPDWPTSVLCGILKLDLKKILVLTLPVLFQSALPTVLSGALLWLAEVHDGKPASRYLFYSAVSLAAVGFFQITLLMASLTYIHKEAANPVHKIERPEDRVVIDYAEKEERKERQVRQLLSWSKLHILVRGLHTICFLLFWMSCSLSQLHSVARKKMKNMPADELHVNILGINLMVDPAKLEAGFYTVLAAAIVPWVMIKVYEASLTHRLKAKDTDEHTPLLADETGAVKNTSSEFKSD